MPQLHFGDLTLDFHVSPSLIHGRRYDVRFEYENDEALFILKMDISKCHHATRVWIDRTIVDCPGLPFETIMIHTLSKIGQDSFQSEGRYRPGHYAPEISKCEVKAAQCRNFSIFLPLKLTTSKSEKQLL